MHITDAACEALSAMLQRKGATERCLRLSTHHGNYRFTIDEPIEQDIVFRFQEAPVLIVSETICRDLWGITIDCSGEEDGKRKLIFRKARAGEPLDVARDDANVVPSSWRASQHEALLAEITEISRQMKELRAASKSAFRDQLAVLEAKKQEKWDAIRAIWAGDGGWHKLQQQTNGKNGHAPVAAPPAIGPEAAARNGAAPNGAPARTRANGAARSAR